MNPELFFVLFCFVGLILVVVITVFSLRTKKPVAKNINAVSLDPEVLISSLKSSYSSKEDLYETVDTFFKNYHTIKPNNTQKKDFLKAVCLHRHTNAQIILKTQETLSNLSPDLKNQLSKIVEIRAGLR